MKEIRQNFEAWYLLSGRRSDLERDGNGYFFNRVNTAWMAYQTAWRQSRAALVVDLSDMHLLPCDKKDVTEALSSAGITVKGEGDGEKT